MAKTPARCNRRDCQTRRNLSKRPELYVTWPKCRMPGCSGRMYVDKYWLRKGPYDHAPICRSDCLPYPHPVSTQECKQREEYALNKSFKPRSKHSPKPLRDDEAPF